MQEQLKLRYVSREPKHETLGGFSARRPSSPAGRQLHQDHEWRDAVTIVSKTMQGGTWSRVSRHGIDLGIYRGRLRDPTQY